MASKRRNMFYENKKQETTEIGALRQNADHSKSQSTGYIAMESFQLITIEQPLLLEELLEEEKREQEKQATVVVSQQGTGSTPLMSDADFEMLKADVLGTNPQVSSPPAVLQGPGLVPQPIRAPFIQRTPGVLQTQTVISRPPPPPPPPPPVETRKCTRVKYICFCPTQA
ncbi:hypothetical protein AAG570_000809 [Ranatra chinensis]|uniref:Uncharacterized protein n=1 Tax=Ranatra chinensis TaxID=642074 RepID=A0ABD0YY54_9HEMI